MSKQRALASVIALLSAAACTPATEPTRTPEPRAAAHVGDAPATAGQATLAHFVTADGTAGFVLDRSTSPIKLRIDGERDIIELTAREARDHRGRLVGYSLLDPTARIRIVLDTDGAVAFVRGDDLLPATVRGDASPLGKPTVAGPPVAKPAGPPRYAEQAAALQAKSARARWPELAAKDSADLAKLAWAFGRAEADMFVRYVAPSDGGWPAVAEDVPRELAGFAFGGGDFSTDDDDAARHRALVERGVHLYGASSIDSDHGNHLLTRRIGAAPPLASGTPGIVWEVVGSKAVFVAFDGGRWTVELDQSNADEILVPGTGPASQWPKPVGDTFVDITTASALANAGALPKATLDELVAIDGRWNACVAKAWKPKRIATDLNVRAEAVKIHQRCRKSMDEYAAALVELIDARAAGRRKLHDAAAARAKAVGSK